MTNSIEIPFNKTKTALLFIVPLILLIIGALAILQPEAFTSPKPNDLEKIKFLGIAGGAIGLLLTIIIIRKFLSQKTGFIIDKSGITDISNASYTGLVEWNDITKIEGKKVGPIKLIILHTNNPEKYINKAKKTAINQMRKNMNFYGSPLLIVSSRLKINYDELLQQLTNEFEKSKGASS
jgi:hypothetical protein